MIDFTDNIKTFIPQREPFVMVDQLILYDEKITRSRFLIKQDNVFIENGKLGEAGLVENIAQTAAARAGYVSKLKNEPVKVGYIGAIKNLVIYALPKVDDELVTEILVKDQIFDVTIIYGKVSHNQVLLAECEMKIFIS